MLLGNTQASVDSIFDAKVLNNAMVGAQIARDHAALKLAQDPVYTVEEWDLQPTHGQHAATPTSANSALLQPSEEHERAPKVVCIGGAVSDTISRLSSK